MRSTLAYAQHFVISCQRGQQKAQRTNDAVRQALHVRREAEIRGDAGGQRRALQAHPEQGARHVQLQHGGRRPPEGQGQGPGQDQDQGMV